MRLVFVLVDKDAKVRKKQNRVRKFLRLQNLATSSKFTTRPIFRHKYTINGRKTLNDAILVLGELHPGLLKVPGWIPALYACVCLSVKGFVFITLSPFGEPGETKMQTQRRKTKF